MSTQPTVLDMDPGIDDALALQYLLASKRWDLKAITVVAGNVPLAQTFANARGLAALFDLEREIPVYGGCPKPLTRELQTAEYVHGEDGMAGTTLPRPGVAGRGEHAARMINKLSHRHLGELTIIALGPLTNVAAALILDPSLARRVKHLTFMGGAVNVPGNVPPGVAEFNAYVDPEAAKIVVESGVPYTMVGLDVTSRAVLTREQIETLDSTSSHLTFTREILGHYLGVYRRSRGWEACALHDPLTVAVAGDPSWVETETGNLYVETKGEYTRGKTSFVSQNSRARRPVEGLDPRLGLGQVALRLDRKDFSEHFIATIDSYAAAMRQGGY